MASFQSASNAAQFFAMALTTDQTSFLIYHTGSYANNSVMLSSRKPLLMRDVFLTKSSSLLPNPLSCIYVHRPIDAFLNSVVSWLLVKPIVEVIGWKSGTVLYVGSGFFSSFAYLLSCQVNSSKTNTRFDCACTSNGAFAGFAALSLAFPRCFVPASKQAPVFFVGVPYLAKCFHEEFIGPKFMERRVDGEVELRNWGFVGGAFFAMIYASLVLRTRADRRQLNDFWKNLSSVRQ
uniref:Peptidase S54 rhomboid domain-containing protein n=1 Tax=Trypanosoma vivax (strain Y486) TaxID=1055687 RepID=G0TXY4_TRYVY|nr:conserved hypothetical protein [Trypanosoma vivax Y486]